MHILIGLTYLPVDNVGQVFQGLQAQASPQLIDFFKYFETYIGRLCTREVRRVVSRYPPKLWSQYSATLADKHKNNNVSEAWHN